MHQLNAPSQLFLTFERVAAERNDDLVNHQNCVAKDRPSFPNRKDGLSRSFVHVANQLISVALTEEKRSA